MRKILFYKTDSGQCPVEEFLDSLDGKQAQKVTWVLQLVEQLDRVPAQYFKKLVNTDAIWEVRVQAGGNIFRLLGFSMATTSWFSPMDSRRKPRRPRPAKSRWPKPASETT